METINEEAKGQEQTNDQLEDAELDNNEAFNKEDLQSRYYRNEWPEERELVMVSLFTSPLRVFSRSKSQTSMKKEPTSV